MALSYSSITIELREILLKNRPMELYSISPKGTVPVLYINDCVVIDESLDIMLWAINQSDQNLWLDVYKDEQINLINENDNDFKYWLDRYKYNVRYPENSMGYYRKKCQIFLDKLEERLKKNKYLFTNMICLSDIAIVPFIRQFANVDSIWFNEKYSLINKWLNNIISSKLFLSVMHKYSEYQIGQKPIITNFNN